MDLRSVFCIFEETQTMNPARNIFLFLCVLVTLPTWSQKFLKEAEIHDYKTGDEFHILHYPCCNEMVFYVEQIVITGKIDFSDLLTYSILRSEFKFFNTMPPLLEDTLSFLQYDTLMIHNPDSVLFGQGDEAYIDPFLYHGRIINTDYFWITNSLGKANYVAGLGKVSLSWKMPPDTVFQLADSLIYYQKGNEEWGETLLSAYSWPSTPKLTIAPNPALDRIYIHSDKVPSKEAMILIINQEGKTVKHYKAKDFWLDAYAEFDVSDLPRGTYFIYLRESKSTLTAKFVKH